MASPQVLTHTPAKRSSARRVVVKQRKTGNGRLRGRWCVSASLYPDEVPKSAVRGVKLAPKQMHGCFLSKKDALAEAQKLVKRSVLYRK